MAFLRLAFKRLVAQRTLALALLITMAFAIGVLAAGPIYTDASRTAILTGEIARSDTIVKNVRFTLNPQKGLAESSFEPRVSDILQGLPQHKVVFMVRSPNVLVTGPRGSSQDFLVYRDGGLQDVQYVAGGPPASGNQLAMPVTYRTVIGGVGDTITLSTGTGQSIDYTISGLFKEPKRGDPRWFGTGAPFPVEGIPTSPFTPPLLGRRDAVEVAIGSLGLDGSQRYDWDVYLNVNGVSLGQLASYGPAINHAQQQLQQISGLSGIVNTTGIDALVDLVRQEMNSAVIPIYLVVFQIGAVALAVLAGVASLALSNQSFELAVLKSRGFSRRQLMTAQTLQSGLAAAVALPLGLFLGLVLAVLGQHAHGPVLPGANFSVSLSFTAVLVGLITALIGVGLVALVTLPHVSRTVIEERRVTSREDRPLLLRFPIELIVFPLGLFAFFEARSRGLGANPSTGSLDPLVLLAPTFLLFAASFAALRLLVWGLRRADGPIGSISNFPTYLVGRRMARSASAGFASSLLLILATGLLLISSSYRATILGTYADIAHQQLGADWQVNVDSPPQGLVALRRLPPNTTGVFTGETDLPDATFATTASTIGIDPRTYAQGGWWRGDYANRSLSDLLAELKTPTPGVPIAAGPLSVVATAGKDLAGFKLTTSVLTPNGAVTTPLAATLAEGTQTYTGTAPPGARLLSIAVQRPEFSVVTEPVELTIESVDGKPGLPAGVTWTSIPWLAAQARIESPGSSGSTQVTIAPGSGQVIGGVMPAAPSVPAFASPDLVQAVGRNFQGVMSGMRVNVHIVDVLRGFPAAPGGLPFLIVPEQTVLSRLESVPESSLGVQQVWASGSDSPAQAIRASGLHVDQVTSAVSVERQFTLNPQSLALGMHFAAAAGGMILVVIGVGVGLYFAQRRRRFEFATLRALGTERRTMLWVMIGEQVAIVGFSLIAAFVLAVELLRLMMPSLGPSISRGFPTPLLVTDWQAVALFTFAVVAAAGISLAFAIRATFNTSVTGVLRGEVE